MIDGRRPVRVPALGCRSRRCPVLEKLPALRR